MFKRYLQPSMRWVIVGGITVLVLATLLWFGRQTWTIGDQIQTLALHPDGRLVALAVADQVILWDLTTHATVRTMTIPNNRAAEVVFSPDGQWLAGSLIGQQTMIWRVADGQVVHTLPGLDAAGAARAMLSVRADDWLSSSAIAWTPDGTTFVRPLSRTMELWDTVTWQLRTTLPGYPTSLAWRPGTTQAALALNTYPRDPVELWQLGVSEPIMMFPVSTRGGKRSLSWSPDGAFLATIDDSTGDTTIHIVDATTGQEVRILAGLQAPPFAVAWSPDGQWIAAANGSPRNVFSERPIDQQLHIWRASTGDLVKRTGSLTQPITGMAWLPDSQHLLTTGMDGKLRRWSAP